MIDSKFYFKLAMIIFGIGALGLHLPLPKALNKTIPYGF